ncbi:putative secreted protein [Cricetibacter osteomyelitidis]|uniref:Putative secreted protein n=1 Tax=Cricetibacter osteomyelitidis TaxID=1521931 RepID=A0A4R2SMG5_9PAST|nr:SIMPL domain-containing protein [Cricetibacter osteomyelitidis]TCP91219.1 putative secreted protein [Cricetibacter osteomyelitidis]
MMKMIAKLKLGLLLPLCLLSTAALADDDKANLINFTVQSEKEMPRDLMLVSLYIQKEGKDINALTQETTKALNELVAQAKSESAVEIKTNSQFSYPKYDSVRNKQNGWIMRAEVVLESKDFATLSQLAEKFSDKWAMENVGFALSRDAMKQVEDEMVQDVIAKFKQKATLIQTAMQAKGYKVQNLNIRSGNNDFGYRNYDLVMPTAKMALSESGTPMELDNGKATLKTEIDAQIMLTNE